MSTTLAAVLWDMDGTLIDSEPIWIAQQFLLAEQHGELPAPVGDADRIDPPALVRDEGGAHLDDQATGDARPHGHGSASSNRGSRSTGGAGPVALRWV